MCNQNHKLLSLPMQMRMLVTIGLLAMTLNAPAFANDLPKSILQGGALEFKVGFLGIPSSTTDEMPIAVPWTRETVGQLKKLGFNAVQVNLAWGTRPADEILNLEDVVTLSPEQEQQYPQVVPLRCKPGAEAREKRRADLRSRIA
jgi:hypothetical protein